MKWIAKVVHRGVEHLDVETDMSIIEYLDVEHGMSPPAIDLMPKYMYVSKTLVSLKLVNVGLENTKFVVSLPCLKIMHLEKIYYTSNGFFLSLGSSSQPLLFLKILPWLETLSQLSRL